MGRTISDLGVAQSRLQALDDDLYIRSGLAGGAVQADRRSSWSGNRRLPRGGRRRDQAGHRPDSIRACGGPTSKSGGGDWFGG